MSSGLGVSPGPKLWAEWIGCFCWSYSQLSGGRCQAEWKQKIECKEAMRGGMEAYNGWVLISFTLRSSHIPGLSWFSYERQWAPLVPEQVSVDLGLWHHPWVIWITPTRLILGEALLSATHQMCGFGIKESNLQRRKLIWGHFFHLEDRMKPTKSKR